MKCLTRVCLFGGCALLLALGCGGVVEPNPYLSSPAGGSGGSGGVGQGGTTAHGGAAGIIAGAAGSAASSGKGGSGGDAGLDVALDAPDAPDAPPGSCSCPKDKPDYPSFAFTECIPPLQIGCAATVCTPGVTNCGEGYSCLECAAAACCYCQACLPSCVFTGPAQGPLPEYLKLNATMGPAYQTTQLSISGFPFYVGALAYLVKVGNSGVLSQTGGSTCSINVTVPGQAPGTVPVWVSQYGGGEPWVLAGFYTWSLGDYPLCPQPGYECGESPCCQTDDVPMACINQRCRLP